LFQKKTLSIQATIATLRAMTLDRLTHLVIEEKNILKIMLNGASRDGTHMNFDFVQGLLVVLQVVPFPKQQCCHQR
jgi:hypothetical protein